MGRGVPPKGAQFSETRDEGIFHCTNSEMGAHIYLSGKGSLLVCNGVFNLLLPRIGVP